MLTWLVSTIWTCKNKKETSGLCNLSKRQHFWTPENKLSLGHSQEADGLPSLCTWDHILHKAINTYNTVAVNAEPRMNEPCLHTFDSLIAIVFPSKHKQKSRRGYVEPLVINCREQCEKTCWNHVVFKLPPPRHVFGITSSCSTATNGTSGPHCRFNTGQVLAPSRSLEAKEVFNYCWTNDFSPYYEQ